MVKTQIRTDPNAIHRISAVLGSDELMRFFTEHKDDTILPLNSHKVVDKWW